MTKEELYQSYSSMKPEELYQEYYQHCPHVYQCGGIDYGGDFIKELHRQSIINYILNKSKIHMCYKTLIGYAI